MYLSTQRLLAKSDLFTKAFLKIVDQFPLLIIWSQSQVLCSKQRHTHHNNRTSHTQKKVKITEKFLGKKEKLSEKVNCDLAVVHYGSEKKYKKR